MRKKNLVYETLPEENELMLVDEKTGRACVLNAEAGAVWLLLNGERDLDDLAALVDDILPSRPAEETRACLEKTLQLLEREGLVE